MKLFWKLLLAFVLVAAIPLTVMAITGRYVAEAAVAREVESNLAGPEFVKVFESRGC